jgi:predicted lipoprotein
LASVATVLQSRGVRFAIAVAGLAVVFWCMPLFHIVSLQSVREQAAATMFDAAGYADQFWQGPLLEMTGEAVDAAELLKAFELDYAAAAERHGHRLGMSSTSYFMVSGRGRITAVDAMAVRISLDADETAEVVIGTGPVFGNAIRDGSGLLDVSDFANIRDFNSISAEINRRVEEQVLPRLREVAEIGAEVQFAGGVEVMDTGGAPSALKLVPVVIEIP